MALQVALALSGLEPEGLFSCGLPKSSSSSSIASSSGASSYYSMESGISSMSPESVSYQHIVTRSSFETLVLNALQQKSESNKTETQEKKSALAAIARPNKKSEEKGESPKESTAKKITIRHMGRDLLDLGSNIRGGWKYQTAKLPDGVGSYFENRSQYSRLQGALPPHHTKVICNYKDCSFIEPIYF